MNRLDLKIKQYLRALEETETYADKSRSILYAAARDTYPYWTKKSSNKSSSTSHQQSRNERDKCEFR